MAEHEIKVISCSAVTFFFYYKFFSHKYTKKHKQDLDTVSKE